ncbi:MAG: transcription antitermination factor NusB [Firmicutes bacterium]|nr:transcription antitermination factor NusB [Bacillota bacterium]
MRRDARELAFKLIFESEFNSQIDVELSFMSDLEEVVLTDEEKKFASQLFELYQYNKEEIEDEISIRLKGYELNRVYKVDIALLKLALTELKYYKKTPAPVVINETLELCKKYSTENSPKFLNGVLGALV